LLTSKTPQPHATAPTRRHRRCHARARRG